MIQNRIRLIGLALLVFVVVPYFVLRHMDQDEQARQSRAGKTVVTHFLGIPPYAHRLEDQIEIAVFRRFLDRPENRDVIIDKFSGLEIRDLPASWDAMIQMAFAADRAPDIVELVTENIQTHRDEQFIRPMPDSFTFSYSNCAYDDLAGYSVRRGDGEHTPSPSEGEGRGEGGGEHPAAKAPPSPYPLPGRERDKKDAGVTGPGDRFRAEQRRQEALFQEALKQARARNIPEDQWLPKVSLEYDWALMRLAGQLAPDIIAPANPPHLAELLDTWNDLMRRSGQLDRVVTPASVPDSTLDTRNSTPASLPAGEALTRDQACHRWLFEKLLARIPADLLRALFDMEHGQLYGADNGEPALMGLKYRIKPFREANLVDGRGRPVLPQSWDELEYWAVAFSVMGPGGTSDGTVGYKLAHGQLIPYPFPLFAYGAGGQLVTPAGGNVPTDSADSMKNKKSVKSAESVGNPAETDIARMKWSCALDSPGTIRGMTWVQHMAMLKPFKLDFQAVPLVLVYSNYARQDMFNTIPDFYLRMPGEARQVVIRRLQLKDWRVIDDGRELFRFAGRQDLLDQLRRQVGAAGAAKVGACQAVRAMDKNDLDEEKRLWDEDKLAMNYQTAHTLVLPNPDAEGINRYPDGPPWDRMVTEADLKDPAALRQLQADLIALGVKVPGSGDSGAGDGPAHRQGRDPNLSLTDAEWGEIVAFKGRERPAPLKRIIDELAALSMPVDLYVDGPAAPVAELRPARPPWADVTQLDRDRRTRLWSWVHLVSPDAKTIVTVDRKYVVKRTEYEAWPGGPRFVDAPTPLPGTNYWQFRCGLQAIGRRDENGNPIHSPEPMLKETYRIQVSIIDMGMLALNSRMNDRTEEERKRLDAAVRLITYISSDEAQQIDVDKKVQNGLGLAVNPVLLRKYGYDDIARDIPPEYEKAIRDLRRIGRAVPPVPNYRGFQQFLAQLGDRIIISQEDPADACKSMTTIVNNRFLGDPDRAKMDQRRRVAWVIFAIVVAALLTAGVWMGRQLIRGVSARISPNSATLAFSQGDDKDLGSVGQRPTWRTHLAAWLFLGPAVLSVFVWSYVPLGWGSVMAFQDFHVIKPTEFVGLDNFIRIFIDWQFYRILLNTIYFVSLSLGLGFLAPVLLALMLNEIPWLKTFYRTVFYLPAITSGLVVMLMWKRFYDPGAEGLLNSLLLAMNGFGPTTTFVLKTLGIAAIPLLILLLYSLPLRDDVQAKFGRFLAALPPVFLTLWLGSNCPPWPLALDALLGAWPLALGSCLLCLAGGLGLLVAAYRCESEFASRRIPWAAPGIVLIFLAGWSGRAALLATGGHPGRLDATVEPNAATSHMAQLFVLLIPLLCVWPTLRRLFGHEHTPRETMYLVLLDKARAAGRSGPMALSSADEARPSACVFAGRAGRRASIAAGLALLAVCLLPMLLAVASSTKWLADFPLLVAYKYLLSGDGAVGWLLNPLFWQPILAIFAALVLARRPGIAAAVLGGFVIALLAALALPDDSPGSLQSALVGGMGSGGWLLRPFVMEPLGWLKDAGLAMLCIILPGVWASMGPGCLIYLAGLKGIPEDVYEAADLDGASSLQKAWTITIPHLAALLIINFVGAFIGAFQASQNVLVMTAGGPAEATMVLGLEVWVDAFVLLRFGYATALAWILGLLLIGFTMYQVSILKKVQFKATGMK